MANEIHTDYPSGSTLYALIRTSGGNVWYIAGEAFEAWGTSGHTADDYDIPLTDRSGSRYEGDFDADVPAGTYTVQIFLQTGSSPDIDADIILGAQKYRWTGSAVAGGEALATEGEGIARADILTFVNANLKRSETDIDIQIQMVLNELRGPYIPAVDDSQTLSDGDEYLASPDGFWTMIGLILNDGSQDLPPLRPFPGGYNALKKEKGRAGQVYTSNPLYYAPWGAYLWLWPLPGQTYTTRIDYYKTHAQDVGNIEFGDEFKNTIKFGACFYVACKHKLVDYINIWGPLYRDEKETMRLMHSDDLVIVGT